ncbi:hypothetical protein K7432_008805 [Basidiobolus ranarum]|uniref:Ketosynthase family 3 (KS3) domain-containing protein n=1 Tax=Basidiobolus ranarum TaxID=34480 RepID=A0ABR2WRA2_9FUNG
MSNAYKKSLGSMKTQCMDIAVIGMACRLPGGVENLEMVWDLISGGTTPISKCVLNNASTQEQIASTAQSLTNDISLFDADYFSMTSKEAESMNPQHQILLEVMYESLEAAGIPMEKAMDTEASCFVNEKLSQNEVAICKATELSHSLAVNRISKLLDLKGYSVVMDTSSSLAALHLAVQSLRTGKTKMALIGDSQLVMGPDILGYGYSFMVLELHIAHTYILGSLSCDSYSHGEGVCSIILKSLNDSIQDANPILAVIRNNSLSSDEPTSGTTVPSAKAPSLYQNVGPGDISHLKSDAGMAGLIKAVLCFKNGKIPPNRHVLQPTSSLDVDIWNMKIPTSPVDWLTYVEADTTENGKIIPCRMSANSFSFHATITHIILECAEPYITENESPTTQIPLIIPLMAKTKDSGMMLLQKYKLFLKKFPKTNILDLAYTLGCRRTSLPWRHFVIASTIDEITKEYQQSASANWFKVNYQNQKALFIFSGQGAQWWAMGRELIIGSMLVRMTLLKCDKALKSLKDGPKWSIIKELLKPRTESNVNSTLYSQPLCTALQIALVDLWKSWDIVPSAVVGHSSGEIGAAYAANLISVEDAMAIAYYRGLHMSQCTLKGSMLATGLTMSEAESYVNSYDGRVSLAAINSFKSTTLSGDSDAIEEIHNTLKERSIFTSILKVDFAFHSHHMVPLSLPYKVALEKYDLALSSPGKVKMFSSVTGKLITNEKVDATYWKRNMISPVLFFNAIQSMLEYTNESQSTMNVLVEIGPHSTFRSPINQLLLNLDQKNNTIEYLPSLTRGEHALRTILDAAGKLFCYGFSIDLGKINSVEMLDASTATISSKKGHCLTDLPTYAWDHSKIYE